MRDLSGRTAIRILVANLMTEAGRDRRIRRARTRAGDRAAPRAPVVRLRDLQHQRRFPIRWPRRIARPVRRPIVTGTFRARRARAARGARDRRAARFGASGRQDPASPGTARGGDHRARAGQARGVAVASRGRRLVTCTNVSISCAERPFALSPDPEYLYPSRVHQEALDYLRYGLESQAGFVVITGEIGSGKTTLLQTLLRESRQRDDRRADREHDARAARAARDDHASISGSTPPGESKPMLAARPRAVPRRPAPRRAGWCCWSSTRRRT